MRREQKETDNNRIGDFRAYSNSVSKFGTPTCVCRRRLENMGLYALDPNENYFQTQKSQQRV